MNISVFDFHCDTALRMLDEKMNPAHGLRQNQGHIDLTRASKLAGYAQCFACFTTSFMEQRGFSPALAFHRELSNLQREECGFDFSGKNPGGDFGKPGQGNHVRHPNLGRFGGNRL